MTADPAASSCRCGTRLARDNTTGLCGACTTQARDLYSEPPAVPHSFWHTAAMQEALASWHMGRVIYAFRTHPYHVRPLAQDLVADWMGITQTQLSRIENGEAMHDLRKLIQWAYTLRVPDDLLWFRLPHSHAAQRSDTGSADAVRSAAGESRELERRLPRTSPVPHFPERVETLPEYATQSWVRMPEPGDTALAHSPAKLEQAELLRRELTDAVIKNAVAQSSIDDWEQTVLRYGQATRDRPTSGLLADLTVDLELLKQTLSRCRSSSALRHLTRLVAQMSGLMCLTLIKLDERAAFRAWAHTARIAAEESEDSITRSWVLAQEAYGHYYSGNLTQATQVARHAQGIVGAEFTVGTVLAAALEARVHAARGRSDETRAALQQAELVLEKLDSGSVNTSAFGYNEAQLRFHEGNAFTHLHDTRSAWKAQERALEICAPDDYMDQTLTHLDRASCLLHDGDAL